MPFTKDIVRLIGTEVEAAIQDIAKKYGATVRRGRGTYDGTTFDLKLKFTTTTAEGLTTEQKDFKEHATLFGFEPDDLGEAILMGGKHFTITGLLLQRPKNCIQITNVDTGKRFISTKRNVQTALKVAKARKANAA